MWLLLHRRAVDREFLNIYLGPLASHGCLWRAGGFLWDDFGLPWLNFGRLRDDFGLSWPPWEMPRGVLGLSLPPFGPP